MSETTTIARDEREIRQSILAYAESSIQQHTWRTMTLWLLTERGLQFIQHEANAGRNVCVADVVREMGGGK